MTETTHEIVLEQGIGYVGKRGIRPYVALITGTDPHYGLRREFLDADRVERDHWGRARYTRTLYYKVAPGLYEISEAGERTIGMVRPSKDNSLRWVLVGDERLTAMLRAMDGGLSFNSARLATRHMPAA